MVRGGKVRGKGNFRKRVRLKEGGSDESDEDYVVSDLDTYVSDCLDDYNSSLDGCASEDSFDGFIEEEEEKEEIQLRRKFFRSRAKNGICGRQEDASKTSRKRGRITYAKQEEQEQEAYADGEDDEDFEYNDNDEEFTPDEEDCSDEELEIRVKMKKNNGVKIRNKVLKRRASVTSTRHRKRRSSRASKKPMRKKRRKNRGLKRKVKCNDLDDFIDNDPAIRTKRRKKHGRVKKRFLVEDTNSNCVSSNYEFTISEEEREHVREAKELCQSLRRNLRSSSFQMIHEESRLHEDLHQQQKPPGQKGQKKIKEPQGRKGKEKVEDLKSEMVKQVCGICLSEENKRRIRGVLNCCTHYFCFSCIMEWGKVESRCPLCKQRFKTISKPVRASVGIDLREMVVEVPERDQVYQPSEEEIRSYIDPYEYVICSECHQGGDDALMLLCDICDSPAHTYCVGLAREVPEGNWYCEGCRPVALGSSSTQVQDRVDDPRVTTQSPPVRPSPVLSVPETIDLNFSPLTYQSQGLGHISSSRFSGRSVEAVSSVFGGGAPTLSERRWVHRQIQQLRSTDRMTYTPARTNGISATSSTSNLSSSQIDQIRETNATPHTRTQEVGTSYHPFLEERSCNNNSPSMQTGDPSSMRISNARRPVVQNSIMGSNSSMNRVQWPGLVGTPSILDNGPTHQFSSRSNIVNDVSLPTVIRDLQQSNFHIVKEQLLSMVKSHLNNLSREIDIGRSTFKEIAKSSTHTLLAACGLEHRTSEVCAMPPPPVCPHIELIESGHASLIKGFCSDCFDSLVRDVVNRIFDTKMSSQPWLRLGL